MSGRIACLLVPDFPLAALLRSEPDLRGRPVAAVGKDDPRASLLAVSPEAKRRGVRAGVSAAQARLLAADVEIRVVAPDVLRGAEDALADVAESFSPRVEPRPGGEVLVDLAGLEGLFGSEAHLATCLAARARRIGLEARVGVATGTIAAALAARRSEGIDVWPDGEEHARLAELPLALLDPADDVAATLERFGLRTLGHLAALPERAVAARLGPAGVLLRRRARGEDEAPLRPRVRPLEFAESLEMDWAVDRFEPLAFLFRSTLERLTARLDVRGFRAGDLALVLAFDDGGREERTVPVAAPTLEVKILLVLLRAHLERHPPRAAIRGFRLAAVAEKLRPVELDLFVPAGPAPAALDAAIARLVAVSGDGRAGRAVVAESHRPDAFELRRFELPPAATAGPGTFLRRRSVPERECAPKGRERQAPSRSHDPDREILALRALRPPLPLEVHHDRGRLDFVRGDALDRPPHLRLAGRVVTLAGPWRLVAEWWREDALARDYYDAALSDGGVYRLFREHASDRWFAAGVYD